MEQYLKERANRKFPRTMDMPSTAGRQYLIRVPYSELDETWIKQVEYLEICSPSFSDSHFAYLSTSSDFSYTKYSALLDTVNNWRIKWFDKEAAEHNKWHIHFPLFPHKITIPLRSYFPSPFVPITFNKDPLVYLQYLTTSSAAKRSLDPKTFQKNVPISWEYQKEIFLAQLVRLHFLPNENCCYFTADRKCMWLQSEKQEHIHSILSKLSDRLRHLYLEYRRLSDNQRPYPLDLSRFPSLKTLYLSLDANKTLCLSRFHEFRSLESLKISVFSRYRIPDWDHFSSKLGAIHLNNQTLGSTFLEIQTNVSTFLKSRYYELLTLPDSVELLHFFPCLQKLDLAYCKFTLPDRLFLPPELTSLNLSFTNLTHIPEQIRDLKKLTHLDLSYLTLEEIPVWLGDLGMDFVDEQHETGINLRGTSVKGLDTSVFSQSSELIAQWFHQRKMDTEGTPLNELKVVFLGDGESGKSLTIARLMRDGAHPKHFDSSATPGIAIENRIYTLDDRTIQVHFWDFGGQEIMHSMHRMFLTDRTLYVILISARDDTQDDRARYWLHNVKSFAKGAPVLLVINKIDQNPTASINEPELRAMYSQLTEIVRMSALEDSPERFNDNFTRALLRQIGSFKTLASPFLPAWSKLKSSLQNMSEYYIRGCDYIRLCEQCGVEDRGNARKALLKWFHDLGVSFCYEGSQKLEDYVILRPEWITNAIYMIVYNYHRDLKNGILPHESIIRLLRLAVDDPKSIQRVLRDVTYTPEESVYVLNVIRKFALSYLVRDGEEFIPMLCERNAKSVALEYAENPAVLDFRMVYDYLPNNVIHRLMVELRGNLDMANVWRTGARFVMKGMGVSAVVKQEDNTLRILVLSDDRTVSPNLYLDYLRSVITNINDTLGLEVNQNLIVYTEGDRSDCIDYDAIVGTLAHGVDTIYSTRFKRMIRINDILNQHLRLDDPQKTKLIQDLVSICQDLQCDPDCWDRDENGLNTLVRNSLRKLGYIVHDQTLTGLGATGKRSGEADLEIRKDPGIPWTILEALWVRGHTNFSSWDQHLKRVLDHYNQVGLPFLLQLCYVDIPKNKFSVLWQKYRDHIAYHDPDGYTLVNASPVNITPDEYGENAFIRAAQTIYTPSGAERNAHATTVYHIFARIGSRD